MKFSAIFLAAVLVLCSTSRAAEDPKWIQSSSEHFLLVTDSTEAKAQKLLTDLEARVAGFSDVFGKVRPRQFPIEVFLFKTREDFLPAMPKLPQVDGEPAPERNAYVVTGPDRIFLVAKDKSPDDIANDAGHALGHVLFEHQVMWRPFWLAEGIAEYVRKMGRDADTKAISEKDGYSVDDLLTIVSSATYQDTDPGGAFRTQSYRLLRLVLQENPQALRDLISELGKETGSQAKLSVDVDALGKKFATYVETPLKLPPIAPAVKTTAPEVAVFQVHRGDVLMAAGNTTEASRWYNANSNDARAGRAIVTRLSRPPLEALQSLAQAAHDLPQSGLVQYHFGVLTTEDPKLIQAQVTALENSVALLPLFGRAQAELARVYALTGKAERGLPLLERAIQLEPEFADHCYEIRAEVLLSLHRNEEALRALNLAGDLPHSDRKTVESFPLKVANMNKRIENARREADAQRLERIRSDVEAKVRATEPVQVPKPVVAVREGAINYELSASGPLEVVEPIFPEYPEALREQGKAGRVVLRIVVGPDGKVRSAVTTTSQFPEMNAATLEAAKKWTFKLPERGRPAPTTVTITFVFALQ